MKPEEFTDETAQKIIRLLPDLPPSRGCCAAVLQFREGQWSNRWQVCYAPTAATLFGLHPDHFGIPFLGAGAGGTHDETQAHTGQYGVETLAFLSALMDPTGPFKGVLPFLYHATPKEVFADKGFVIYRATEIPSPGLLWTFLQAARMLWEHADVYRAWCEARKHTKDHIVALYIALALALHDKEYQTHRVGKHGDSLGSAPGNPYRLRESFLRGIVVPGDTQHRPFRSWACFPALEPLPGNVRKPLDEWVQEFETIREKRS